MLKKSIYFKDKYLYLDLKFFFKGINELKIFFKKIFMVFCAVEQRRFAKYIVDLLGRRSQKEFELGFKALTEISDQELLKEIIDLLGANVYDKSPLFFLLIENFFEQATDDIKAYFLGKQLYFTRHYLDKKERQDIGDVQYKELIELIGEIELAELRQEIYEEAANYLSIEYAHYADLFTRKNYLEFVTDRHLSRLLELIFLAKVFPLVQQKKLQTAAEKTLEALLTAFCAMEETQIRIARSVDSSLLVEPGPVGNFEKSILLAQFIEETSSRRNEEEKLNEQDKYHLPEYYDLLKDLFQRLIKIVKVRI